MHKEAEFLQKLLPGYYMVCITQDLGPSSSLSWQLFCPEHLTGQVLHVGVLWPVPVPGTVLTACHEASPRRTNPTGYLQTLWVNMRQIIVP